MEKWRGTLNPATKQLGIGLWRKCRPEISRTTLLELLNNYLSVYFQITFGLWWSSMQQLWIPMENAAKDVFLWWRSKTEDYMIGDSWTLVALNEVKTVNEVIIGWKFLFSFHEVEMASNIITFHMKAGQSKEIEIRNTCVITISLINIQLVFHYIFALLKQASFSQWQNADNAGMWLGNMYRNSNTPKK